MEVLVLNRVYFAVHIVEWTKCMTLLYKGAARVIDDQFNSYNFEEWAELSKMMQENPAGFVHSVSQKIAIPEIIALTQFDRLPDTEVKFTRKNLYHHYGLKCCYCGRKRETKDLNLDHVTPKSRGGSTSWANIVLACIPCNLDKGDKTVQEAGLKMHYQPSKPRWRPSYVAKLGSTINIRQSWAKFIDFVYWNSELTS
jgi:5-methylcytosine-specific restriction endonuclease McrA